MLQLLSRAREKIYKLNLYSKKLTLQFQFYLLETKKFHKNSDIMNKFINAFIEKNLEVQNLLISYQIFNREQKEKRSIVFK